METLTLEMERRVRASPEAARRAVITALEGLKFSIDLVRGSRVDAHSGTAWLPRLGVRRPVRARANLLHYGSDVKINLHLSDGEELVISSAKAPEIYAALFAEVCDNIDQQLRSIDPDLKITASSPVKIDTDRQRRQAQFNALVQKLSANLTSRESNDSQAIHLIAPGHWAVIDASTARDLLSSAAVVSQDADIPVTLVASLDSLQRSLELAVRTGSSAPIQVDDRGRRLTDFLHRQVVLRKSLPAREVLRCRDCGFERISNPEANRGSGSKVAWSLAGAAASVAYNPLAAVSVAGRLMGGRQTGPRFTCSRCQGIHVDVTPATICPSCLSIRKDFVLRKCANPECGYDFLARGEHATLWNEGEPELHAEDPVDSSREAAASSGGLPHNAEKLRQTARLLATRLSSPMPKPRTDLGATAVPNDTVGIEGSADPPRTAEESGGGAEPDSRAKPRENQVPRDPSVVPQGWYPDPAGRHEWRWYDGGNWTPHVSDRGVMSTDEI